MAEIILSGIKGDCGSDGRDGKSYGDDGTNAGPAEIGGDAGEAYLRIQRVPENPSAILVTGTIKNFQYNNLIKLGNGFL